MDTTTLRNAHAREHRHRSRELLAQSREGPRGTSPLDRGHDRAGGVEGSQVFVLLKVVVDALGNWGSQIQQRHDSLSVDQFILLGEVQS